MKYKSKSTPDAFATLTFVMAVSIAVPNLLLAIVRMYQGQYLLGITFGLISVIMLAVIVCGIIYTPYSIVLTDDTLIVKRHSRAIVIPLHAIQAIRLVRRDEKSGIKATISLGYGLWGNYKSKQLGRFYLTVRRADHWVLVVTSGKQYIIAPNDIGLVNAVNEQLAELKDKQ